MGTRLTVRGGREAVTRLILTTVAVAVGVSVMLGILSLFNAYQKVSNRPCWECTTGAGATAGEKELWNFSQDFYEGTEIRRVDVAALTADAPVIPGMTKVPAPGEYYVSPALHDLLATTPADQLGARFPGHEAGVIGDAALFGPDELAVVIGHSPDELANRPATQRIGTISTAKEHKGTTDIYRFAFAFGTVALLLPITIMVGTATRLSAARREERYAAMRLVGATPRQVGIVASVESFLGAALGAVLGTAVFLAVRSLVAKTNVTGDRFFPSDVTPHAWGYLAVLVLVPLAAALAAVRSLRRVQYDPLGVSRKATPKPPSAWRAVPLLLGVALFVVALNMPARDSSDAVIYPALILTIWGVVFVGPWLTMQASKLLARFARGAASTLAARRLADDPRATFRTVSGLTIAVFVGTAVAGVLPSAITAATHGQYAPLSDVLRLRYDMNAGVAKNIKGAGDDNPGLPPATAATAVADLRAMPGVSVIPVYRDKPMAGWQPGDGGPPPADWHPPYEYVRCADVSVLPALGRCAPGQGVALIASYELFIDNPLMLKLPVVGYADLDRFGNGVLGTVPSGTSLESMNVSVLMVAAHDKVALEKARTYLAVHVPVLLAMGSPDQWSTNAVGPMTFGEVASVRGAMYAAAQQMIEFGVVVTLFVAGCSLAVATAGSLVERKRPFTLLRLTGTSVSVLRRVVFLESALPLLTVSATAAAAAYAMAIIGVKAMAPNVPMSFPLGTYSVTVAVALAAAMAVIVGSMTLLSRMTRSEYARFE